MAAAAVAVPDALVLIEWVSPTAPRVVCSAASTVNATRPRSRWAVLGRSKLAVLLASSLHAAAALQEGHVT